MGTSGAEFEDYVMMLAERLGHADRVVPMRSYCTGLMLPVERKSIEPMAAQLAPTRVRAEHQRLHHFVANAAWDDAALLGAVREHVVGSAPSARAVPAVLILDDTGFPKKGKASVGVARQYCGQVGKQDNCQVAVSVSLANEHYSLPVAYRLYLPESWASDAPRRASCGVPDALEFATKPRIALALLEQARTGTACPGTVVADAGYGVDTAFRERLSALGLSYVVGITGAVSLWPEGQTPGLPQRTSKRGRPPTRLRDEAYPPVSAKALALQLPPASDRRVTWREGTNTALRSRFAAVRVRAAHRHRPRPEEWLLIEWPAGDAEPFKYFRKHAADTHAPERTGPRRQAALAHRA